MVDSGVLRQPLGGRDTGRLFSLTAKKARQSRAGNGVVGSTERAVAEAIVRDTKKRDPRGEAAFDRKGRVSGAKVVLLWQP